MPPARHQAKMWAGIWRRSSGGLVVARSSAERFVTAGNFAPFGLIQYSGTRVAVSRCRNLGSDTHTFRSLIVCNTDRRDCLFHHMIISQRFLLTKRISTLMILGALSRRVPCSYAGRWVSMPNALSPFFTTRWQAMVSDSIPFPTATYVLLDGSRWFRLFLVVSQSS